MERRWEICSGATLEIRLSVLILVMLRFHTGCLVVSTTINTANYVSLLSALCFLSLGVNKRGGDKGGIKSKVIRDEANV